MSEGKQPQYFVIRCDLNSSTGMLLFTAVEANLALSGFINRKALENIWRQVDMVYSQLPNVMCVDVKMRLLLCIDR